MVRFPEEAVDVSVPVMASEAVDGDVIRLSSRSEPPRARLPATVARAPLPSVIVLRTIRLSLAAKVL